MAKRRGVLECTSWIFGGNTSAADRASRRSGFSAIRVVPWRKNVDRPLRPGAVLSKRVGPGRDHSSRVGAVTHWLKRPAGAGRMADPPAGGTTRPDGVIRDGLGRRWAFIGPFEVGDLNAPAGLADYLQRFAPTIEAINAPAADGPFQLQPGNVAALLRVINAMIIGSRMRLSTPNGLWRVTAHSSSG